MFLSDLYKYLQGNATIQTNNIYPHVFPEDKDRAITFMLDNSRRTYNIDGTYSLVDVNMRFDIYGQTFSIAWTLAEQFTSEFGAFQGPLQPSGTVVNTVQIDNETSDFYDAREMYIVSYEMTITYCT